MYIITKVLVDREKYISSGVADHTGKTISVALALLERSAKEFIQTECGKQVSDSAKIIDILSESQVVEPLIDTMVIYRLEADSQKLQIYQRKTVTAPGYIYGQTIVSEFKKVAIFELIDYSRFNGKEVEEVKPSEVEMIKIGPAGVEIPKAMTMVPVSNLLEELRMNPRFLNRKAFDRVEEESD